MEWNPYVLLQHQNESKTNLDLEEVDLCLITETHFTKQSCINFVGYRMYHTIHPDNTAKGGSAIIIRNNIQHHEKSKYQSEHIRVTTVSN